MYLYQSSTDFWKNHRLTWQKCADLPGKLLVTELDGNVYVAVTSGSIAQKTPYMYNSNEDQWSVLPEMYYSHFSLVAMPSRKQLLAIGGRTHVVKVTNKVFLWDEKNMKWLTPYPDMPTTRHSPTWYSSVLQQNQVENLGNI